MRTARPREQIFFIERRNIDGIEDIHELVAIPRRLREAAIEAAAARARNMRPDAVEYLPMLFIFVESVIKIFTKKAPALRNPERNRTFFGTVRAVFEIGNEIAHTGKTKPGNRRVFGFINDLIDPPRREAAIERNMRGITEAPFCMRDQSARAKHGVSNK